MAGDDFTTPEVDESADPEGFEAELMSLAEELEPEEAAPEPAAAEGPAPAKPATPPAEHEPGGDLRVALRQSREELRALRDDYSEKMRLLVSRIDELRPEQEPEPEPELPSLNDDPSGFFRALIHEELKPLMEGREQDDAAAQEKALSDVGADVGAYVETDWKIGVEKHGEETLAKAIQFVVGEEIRGIRSRNPTAGWDWVVGKFYQDVLPSLQVHYAINGYSLVDMVMERATAAGALPAPADPTPAPKPRAGRVQTAAAARPSLSQVPGTTPRGEPSLDEVLAMPTEQYAKWVGKAGFNELLQMLKSTPA